MDAEVEGFLFLEIDGSAFHDSRDAREADAIRDAGLVARGRPVIRLRTHRIRNDWPGCVADLLAALEHRPPAFRFQDYPVLESGMAPFESTLRNTSTTES